MPNFGVQTDRLHFARIIDILKDAGYRGYIVLEYEESQDPFKAIPTYLRGDWYRDWGAIERYYRAVPAQQAPDAAIEEGTTRVFGWSRGGPIRALP